MKYLKAVLAAALLSCSMLAQADFDPAEQLPVSPQVRVGKLPNGLTYYIQRNPKPQQKVELRLAVKAGSILEDDDQQGLAHFTEHMAFNGSTNFKRHELVSWLQSIGVKFGADLNAYTGVDETVYMLPIPVDRKENLDKGLLVLEDWAHGVQFNDADVESERNIVLEELRLGRGAADRMNKILLPKLFNGSRYAERLPIGKAEVLRTFKPETIRRFYRDWYRPDLMAVLVVGDVDPMEAEKLVVSHFSKLTNPDNPRPRNYAEIPERTTSEALVITDREATNNVLHIRYPILRKPEGSTFGEYRERLIENLGAQMLSQRIAELTQQANPPFIQGSSTMGRVVRGYRSFSSVALLGRDGPVPAINALVQEGERVRQFGFTPAELDRAKKATLRNIERLYNEREKSDSGMYAAEYLRNFLEGEAMPGIENEYNYLNEMVPKVTLEEVNASLRSAIPDGKSKLVIYMGNDKIEVPPAPELLAAVDAAQKAVVTAREDKAYTASLIASPPKPGKIVKETGNKALGTTELTLSNGARIVLKPTDFRNDQVLMSAVRFGGQSLFDEQDIFNARYASTIVAQMGVAGFTPLDLSRTLAGKTANVGMSLSPMSEGLSGNSGSADVETMLQLVHLAFTQPRRDEELFHSFIGKQQELARNSLSRPESVMADTMRSTLYSNHPRIALVPRPEEFEGIPLDRVLGIYKERFSSVRGMTFFIVGSFDLAKIKPLLATYIGSLPGAPTTNMFKDRHVRPVRGVVTREVRRGKDSKSTINLTFAGEATFSADEQMRLQALLDVLNIKLIEVLREKEALIYGGGAGGALSRHPYGNYTINLSLPTGPENVEKVLNATFAEIRKLQNDGPQADDLAKVKENWSSNHRKMIRENSYWIGALQGAYINNIDPLTILRHAERVAALKPADLQAAAKRYFDFSNYVQVVLYPEAKAATKTEPKPEPDKLPPG
jgi:zinc protease